ncbi:DUF1232 domain-containing protein [Heyndrickxia acidicola]|uniref:DUF1232 domain-containing protein n=1 Tax=Heyndrickxia acidicola TaxID=209389 RepID=A0ABU6MJY4_9BACI|nr:DUF1232 domain-containing protein [Heyndrickxia acidicola]MED1203552.1 DUF1232 domain-containing protein [Heyndrickxia acidicola]
MPEVRKKSKVGLLIKERLKERSLSMSKLSELTKIDTATISRIINSKRKASPEHLRKIAECLEIPISELFVATGYLPESEVEKQYTDDLHSSIDTIQTILETSNLLDKKFTIKHVEQKLTTYAKFSKTEEGKEIILTGFEEKLQKVGGIGPIISQLKDMFDRFRLKKGTPSELAIMGGALIYFILPVDLIPDYIFPIGYLDDAIVVQLALSLLQKKEASKL